MYEKIVITVLFAGFIVMHQKIYQLKILSYYFERKQSKYQWP